MAESTATVNPPNGAYNDMRARFALCETLMGGTLAMRAAKTTYLPQFVNESDERYKVRLANSVLFELFKNTVQMLSQKPFGDPVLLKDATPFFEDIANNVDLTGTTLTTFARDLLCDLLVYGKCHILVDYPDTTGLKRLLNREKLTLRDEQVFKIRPYMVRVSPADVIGWKGRRLAGVEELTRVRFREETVEEHSTNTWDEITKKRVVVWTNDTIDTYIEDDKGNWHVEASHPNAFGKVPLVTVYANRQGLLKAYPTMRGLADLSQKHWRNSSDQDSIETVNRVPILALLGFSEDEVSSMEVGPYKAIRSKSGSADVRIVETTGKAVEVGQKGLDRLESQMQSLTLAPLVRRSGNPTATGLAIDAAREISDLEAYVMLLEQGLGEALQLCKDWHKVPEDPPQVSISGEFMPLVSNDGIKALQWDLQQGLILPTTYLNERKRLGAYHEDFSPEDELDQIAQNEGGEEDDDDLRRVEEQDDDDIEEDDQ